MVGGPRVGLVVDAVHEDAGEQEVRHHRDGRRAEAAAAFQCLGHRRGCQGDERGLDEAQPARVLEEPPDFVQVGIGVGVAGPAPDEHHPELARIVGADGGADAVLGEPEHQWMDAERAPVLEPHSLMAAAPAFERRRAVVLHVAGTEEDERDGADRGGAAADERVDGGVEVGLGQLDETAADLEAVRLAPQHIGELPVLVDAGGRAAAVTDEEQRGTWPHDAFPSDDGAARRTSALTAAAATALPPFSPTLEIAGNPLARRRAFDSPAPPNPTGIPITRAGSKTPRAP